VLALVFVGGAGAADVCKLFLDCPLGSKSSLENEIVRYQGTIRSVSSSGRPVAQPFLDLRAQVTASYFRSILGLRVRRLWWHP
jgi:hypothetical protein